MTMGGPTCQNGPGDTICTKQEYCDGSSTCCYQTGACKNSQAANCDLAAPTDPRFPTANGPDMVNQVLTQPTHPPKHATGTYSTQPTHPGSEPDGWMHLCGWRHPVPQPRPEL